MHMEVKYEITLPSQIRSWSHKLHVLNYEQ